MSVRTGGIVIFLIALALVAYVFLVPQKPSAMEGARTHVVGLWQGVSDEKFTREFKSNGIVIDAYAGSEIDATGQWVLFTKEMPPVGYTGELQDKAIYLAIGMPNSETLYFQVTNIDAGSLELVYLNRGGTLVFKKI